MKPLDELLRIAEHGTDAEYDSEFWSDRETVTWLIRSLMKAQHAWEAEMLMNKPKGDTVKAGSVHAPENT